MEFNGWGDFPMRTVNLPPESSSLDDEFSRLHFLRNASRSAKEDDGAAFEFSLANLNQDPYYSQPLNFDHMGFQSQIPYSNRSSPDYFLADRPGQNYTNDFLDPPYQSGDLVNQAMDQRGARILQNALDRFDGEADIEHFLDEMLVKICDLSVNQAGNNVVRKLIELSNERQRTRIANALASNPIRLFRVCLNVHGFVLCFLSFPNHINFYFIFMFEYFSFIVQDSRG